MKNRNGFTLIEVIVTILIIALLTVIMIPVVQNSSARVKYKSYKNLENLIIQATIDYLNHSSDDDFSIDSIKPKNKNCEDISDCSVRYDVGTILDNNIYYTNEKIIDDDGVEKPTVFNPTNGKSMRERTFLIYYDVDTFSLKGIFSEGIDDKDYESEIE